MIINYVIIFNLLYFILADQLLSVHIIWRHGARKPYFCNYNCTSEQLSQLSQLTPTGMRQQYLLGQWIKKKYIDTGFISSIFNENEIYIESSDTNRTIMSAYANLMGMYPEGFNVPNINESFLLPPIKDIKTPDGLYNYALPNHMALIPIHSIQNDQDYYMYMYCPVLWDEGKHNQNTDIFYDINNRTLPLINRVNKELNLNLINIVQLYEWRDTFISNIYNGEENPKELTSSLMSELDKIAGLGFLLQYTQDYYQAQLLTSEFFRILLNEQDNIINQTSKIKYHAFSAHDSTIYALLYALNLTNVECYNQTYFEGKSNQSTCITTYPDFTANIIFELYNNPINGPYIKLMYNGTYMNICHPKATTCQYTHFKSIIKGIILDYKKECQIEEQQIQINEKTPSWAIILFIFIILFTIITIIGIICIKNKKQQDNKIQEQINDLNF